jgi:hypothetical protein
MGAVERGEKNITLAMMSKIAKCTEDFIGAIV